MSERKGEGIQVNKVKDERGIIKKKEKEENQENNKDIFKSLFASKLKILNRNEVISRYIQYTKIKL